MTERQEIRAIIIDDETLARKLLVNYLKDISGLTIIAEFDNGLTLLKELPLLKPDLIFLDIQMPKLNGFEVLELISKPPAIIFTTAYEQYALKAFEHEAVDYLLKPFAPERLKKAIEKFRNHGKTNNFNKKLLDKTSDSVGINPESDKLKRIIVKDGGQIHFIPLNLVHYLEAQDDYVLIVYSKQSALKQATMKYFEERLPANDFIRIHRSYIVAVSQIRKLEQNGRESYSCVLNSGKKLPISKSGMSRLRLILND